MLAITTEDGSLFDHVSFVTTLREEDHMGEVGKSQVRVDAYDKATGRTKYYEDLI